MKILFVGNDLVNTNSYTVPNIGGSVRTWGLFRELAKRDHEVFIVRRSGVQRKETVEGINLGIEFN